MSRQVGIAAIALLGVLAILGFAAQGSSDQSRPARASPPGATAESDALHTEFLPLLQRALATADLLVAMGESRERNLLVIHERQSAMLDALAAADAWVAANPDANGAPVIAAYRDGASEIRAAMDEARDGFLHLDFDRVARATTTMTRGATALRQAVMLLGGGAISDATPSIAGSPEG